MKTYPILLAALALSLGACKKSEPEPAGTHAEQAVEPHAKEAAPAAPAAAGLPDCGSLQGDNAVMTEMRQLECALQRAVAAVGRDDLAVIPELIHVVHGAKQNTAKALETGAYKVPNDDVKGFVAMDEAFHASLVGLLQAAKANDHAATGAALGTVLAQCQGCHATYRPNKPAGALGGTPAAAPAPAPSHDEHAPAPADPHAH